MVIMTISESRGRENDFVSDRWLRIRWEMLPSSPSAVGLCISKMRSLFRKSFESFSFKSVRRGKTVRSRSEGTRVIVHGDRNQLAPSAGKLHCFRPPSKNVAGNF